MEKKFEAPELIIISFTNEDIITSSKGDDNGVEWDWDD